MKSTFTQTHIDQIEYLGMSVERLLEVDPILMLHRIHNIKASVCPVFRALMIASMDHGLSPPSTISARLAASCGAPLPQSLAAAFSTFGPHHGPVVQAALMLREERTLNQIAKISRVPGFGHPIHRCDPRVDPLVKIGQQYLSFTPFTTKLMSWDRVIEHAHPNLAGVMAALMLDCGWPVSLCGLPLLMGRMMGISKHFLEQQTQGQCVTWEKLKDE